MKKYMMNVEFESLENLSELEEKVVSSIYYYEEECGINVSLEEIIEDFDNVSGGILVKEEVEKVIEKMIKLNIIKSV